MKKENKHQENTEEQHEAIGIMLGSLNVNKIRQRCEKDALKTHTQRNLIAVCRARWARKVFQPSAWVSHKAKLKAKP